MPSKALATLLLMLLAVGTSAASRVGSCIPVAGQLLDACEAELDHIDVQDKLPVTSTAPPNDTKVWSVVASLPNSLPTVACCSAVAKFRDTGCGCVSGLAAALADAFAEMTTPGLQGAVKVLATACACPSCAPSPPNATTAPAAGPSVQAASKP